MLNANAMLIGIFAVQMIFFSTLYKSLWPFFRGGGGGLWNSFLGQLAAVKKLRAKKVQESLLKP